MPTYKTKGIVLRRSNFGEADRVITFLTPDHGKLRAVAKGVRRIKSRMAGHLELFNVVELMLAEGKNLDIVTSARLIQSADQISSDYERLGYGYLFAEMIDRLLEVGEQNIKLFENLIETYRDLSERGHAAELELWFKLQLLDSLGYRPHLDGCVVCHRSDSEIGYNLNPQTGGIICTGCSTSRQFPMSTAAIKLWRLVLDNPLEGVRRVNGAGELSKSTLALADELYDFTFGKRFHSQAFLAKMAP
jgi:DNA repair protein RecO (recombination protein O)